MWCFGSYSLFGKIFFVLEDNLGNIWRFYFGFLAHGCVWGSLRRAAAPCGRNEAPGVEPPPLAHCASLPFSWNTNTSKYKYTIILSNYKYIKYKYTTISFLPKYKYYTISLISKYKYIKYKFTNFYFPAIHQIQYHLKSNTNTMCTIKAPRV